MKKVIVLEGHGEFSIEVKEYHSHDIVSSRVFHFDQEDSVKELTEVFKELGFESEYEEVY